MDGLDRVLLPQHIKTQLDAQHAVQINDGPFEAKACHMVEVIRSHRHLLAQQYGRYE